MKILKTTTVLLLLVALGSCGDKESKIKSEIKECSKFSDSSNTEVLKRWACYERISINSGITNSNFYYQILDRKREFEIKQINSNDFLDKESYLKLGKTNRMFAFCVSEFQEVGISCYEVSAVESGAIDDSYLKNMKSFFKISRKDFLERFNKFDQNMISKN